MCKTKACVPVIIYMSMLIVSVCMCVRVCVIFIILTSKAKWFAVVDVQTILRTKHVGISIIDTSTARLSE